MEPHNWPNSEFYLAGEITQVIDSIPWVRCASGNVWHLSCDKRHRLFSQTNLCYWTIMIGMKIQISWVGHLTACVLHVSRFVPRHHRFQTKSKSGQEYVGRENKVEAEMLTTNWNADQFPIEFEFGLCCPQVPPVVSLQTVSSTINISRRLNSIW